jgi:hypothetical protein
MHVYLSIYVHYIPPMYEVHDRFFRVNCSSEIILSIWSHIDSFM